MHLDDSTDRKFSHSNRDWALPMAALQCNLSRDFPVVAGKNAHVQ
jgi:hypothetical protein